MTKQYKNPFEDPEAELWGTKIKDYKIPKRKEAPQGNKAKPATVPISNEEIVSLEQALDQRANKLVAMVNDLCQPVRQRNAERWKKFSYWCRPPVIGDLIFSLFRAPKGLEQDPVFLLTQTSGNYRNAIFIPNSTMTSYKTETQDIEKEARRLEILKAAHMGRYGDEIVEPCNPADPSGYSTPKNMSRRECYAQGLTPFLPDKYDFHSAAGAGKMMEGSFVMDDKTKRIVPENKCDFIWTDLRRTATGLIERIVARTARSGALYYYRG